MNYGNYETERKRDVDVQARYYTNLSFVTMNHESQNRDCIFISKSPHNANTYATELLRFVCYNKPFNQ
jgi:hypothetical protein